MKKKLSILLITLLSVFTYSENIKIGVIAPLTKDYSQYGKETLNGLNFALRENENINLLVGDNQGDSVETIRLFRSFAEDDSVKLIVGPILNENAKLVREFAEKYQIPTIFPTSTDLLANLSKESSKFCFRIPYIEEYTGKIMADFAFYEFNADSVLIIKDINSDYSIINSSTFKKRLRDLNSAKIEEVVIDENIEKNLDIINADIIFFPYSEKLDPIIKKIRSSYPEKPILGTEKWNKNLVDLNYKNIYLTTRFVNDTNKKIINEFLEKYNEEYEIAPTLYSAFGYDLGKMILEVIKEKETRTDIRNEILEKTKFTGVTGVYRFDKNLNPVKSGYIEKIGLDGFTYYCTVNPDFVGQNKKIEKQLIEEKDTQGDNKNIFLMLIILILFAFIIHTINKT